MHRASGLRSQYHVLLLAPLAVLIILALIFGRSLLGSPTPGTTTFSSEPLSTPTSTPNPSSTTAAAAARKHPLSTSPASVVVVAPAATGSAGVKDLGVAKSVLSLQGPAQARRGDVVVFVVNGAKRMVKTDDSVPFAARVNVGTLPNGRYTVSVLWVRKGAGTSVASTGTIQVKHAAAASGTTSGSDRPAGAPGSLTLAAQYVAQVVSITNAERAKAGCDPLTLNSKLTDAARDHTSDMARKDNFSHNSKDGSSPFDRMKAAGYSFSAAGENIAMGQQTARAVMTAWMNSPGHRANILNCTYTEIGVGYAVDTSGAPYWTQDFGKPL